MYYPYLPLPVRAPYAVLPYPARQAMVYMPWAAIPYPMRQMFFGI